MNIKRILVVDDDPEDSEFFITVVHQIDPSIKVAEALTKEEMFRQLNQDIPDLIFIDSFLQQDSGLEIIKSLSSNPSFTGLPVIMYTGSSDHKNIRAAFAAGASSYIIKPHSPAEIKAVLQKLFDMNWNAGNAVVKQYYSDQQFQSFEP